MSRALLVSIDPSMLGSGMQHCMKNVACCDTPTFALTDFLRDFKLEQDALAWAQKLAAQGSLQHSSHQSENIAWFSNKQSNPCQEATKNWFTEESMYVGGTLDQQADWSKVGHFTQAIWKDTNRFGIAHAVSSSGQTFVVGVYYPGGK